MFFLHTHLHHHHHHTQEDRTTTIRKITLARLENRHLTTPFPNHLESSTSPLPAPLKLPSSSSSSSPHPALGPLLPLPEAQAREDIRRRGFELHGTSIPIAEKRPEEQNQKDTPPLFVSGSVSRSGSGKFPVPMPKRKPVPPKKTPVLPMSSSAGEKYYTEQRQKKTLVNGKGNGNGNGKEGRGGKTARDAFWDKTLPETPTPFPRSQLPREGARTRVLKKEVGSSTSSGSGSGSASPEEIWARLEAETNKRIKSWLGSVHVDWDSNLGSGTASAGRVWRRMEKETDGVIRAWPKNPE